MTEPDGPALLAAPLGPAVLAELIGLDLEAELGDEVAEGSVRLVRADGGRKARQRERQEQRRGQPDQRRSAADVIAAAVALADLGQLASCADRLLLLSAVAKVIDGSQADAGPYLAAAADTLAPVALALVTAPAARWWWAPLSCDSQRWTGPDGTAPARGAALAEARDQAAAAEEAEEERRRQPVERRRWRGPDQPSSGTWWSTLLGGTVFTSTGPIGVLPAVGLGCVEDNAGEERMAVWTAGTIGAPGSARSAAPPTGLS